MAKIIDLTGKKFGRWTVLEEVGRASYNNEVIWRCQCTCGNYADVASSDLRKGKSCGCRSCRNKYRNRRNTK